MGTMAAFIAALRDFTNAIGPGGNNSVSESSRDSINNLIHDYTIQMNDEAVKQGWQ